MNAQCTARRSLALAALLTAVLALAAPAAAQEFTDAFLIDECSFSSVGANPYFSLEPGDRLEFAGDDDGEEVTLVITVLDQTQTVRFTTAEGERMRVRARIVEEREAADGELTEISRNYYARCAETGDVYYFGEDVDIYEDGEVVSHDGAWLAGRDGAQPGIIMPGTFLLGSRYAQEVAPGIALDRAEHTAMFADLDTPAGTFEDCVEVIETTPLEPGHESLKRYCAEVGLVLDGVLELVDFERDDD